MNVIRSCLIFFVIFFTLSQNVLSATPEIYRVTPNAGSSKGGKQISIKGKGFKNVTALSFGSQAASFEVINHNHIKATVPPYVTGVVSVSVSTSEAISPQTSETNFTYKGDWFAYVNDSTDNAVTPINLANNKPKADLTVGSFPSSIAITPNGQFAYVTNQSDNSVTIIDLINNQPVSISIPVGQSPFGIAITPDGQFAYVANIGDTITPGTVSVIGIAENTVIATALAGIGAFNIAITPDGKTAFVTNQGDNTVTPIDIATNIPGLPIAVGEGPTGIAITPDGKTAYVANFGFNLPGNTVTPIDISTYTPGTPILVGEGPVGIAITPNGKKAYVANFGFTNYGFGNTVTPIDIATNTTEAPIQVKGGPIFIAITPNSEIAYVTNLTHLNQSDGVGLGKTINLIDIKTNKVTSSITGRKGPLGITITPDQAPQAFFTTLLAPAQSKTFFDASASKSPVGKIANYTWDFGDGSLPITKTSPFIKHRYKKSGSYTVTLIVTNSAGTSNKQVFTGQTVSNQGSAKAVFKTQISIRKTDDKNLEEKIFTLKS